MIGKEGVSMSSIPTVSIGMPVFNNVNTISEAIDMILNQSLTASSDSKITPSNPLDFTKPRISFS